MKEPKSLYQSPSGATGPFLERQKVSNREAPLVDSLQQVRPDRPRQVRELNLRQSNPRRRWSGRDLALLRSFTGSLSARKRLYEVFSRSFASTSAHTPRSASATNSRLMVTCCSLAVRRTSKTSVAGMVTLWRMDLDEAVFRVATLEEEQSAPVWCLHVNQQRSVGSTAKAKPAPMPDRPAAPTSGAATAKPQSSIRPPPPPPHWQTTSPDR